MLSLSHPDSTPPCISTLLHLLSSFSIFTDHAPVSRFLLSLLPRGRKALTLSLLVFSRPLPQFLSQSLVAIDDDHWLEHLVRVVLERIRYFSDEEEEKVRLGVWWPQGGRWVDSGAREAWWGRAGEMCTKPRPWGKVNWHSCVLGLEGERTRSLWWSHRNSKNTRGLHLLSVLGFIRNVAVCGLHQTSQLFCERTELVLGCRGKTTY